MTIPFKRYVDINSSVSGGFTSGVESVELITRIFTENALVPTNGSTTPVSIDLKEVYSVLEFTSAQSVGNYFGTTSEEYLRSVVYFSWVSKLNTSPKKISFSRRSESNTSPEIYGAKLTTTLAQFQAITNGSFTLTLGGVTNSISGLDFSLALSFTDCASVIETAIQLQTGVQWTNATVLYNASKGSFDFVGGDDSVPANVIVAVCTVGLDISSTIGWLPSAGVYPLSPLFSFGVQEETITETLTRSEDASNNFGSYLFIPVLTEEEVTESATWNDSKNNLYQYLVPVSDQAMATLYSTNLASIGGTALTLQFENGEFAEMAPGMILAATPYETPDSTQNYMFQKFPDLTPSVSDGDTANLYDSIGVNYYGLTQNAGQLIAFYQKGVMTGKLDESNAIDQNVYANEQWLKNENKAALGTLLISSTKISANSQGSASCLAVLELVASRAVSNGVITTNGFLTAKNVADIIAITNDRRAPEQVKTTGYWLNTYITQVVDDYIMNYTLVYKKNDVIRKIVGEQNLI